MRSMRLLWARSSSRRPRWWRSSIYSPPDLPTSRWCSSPPSRSVGWRFGRWPSVLAAVLAVLSSTTSSPSRVYSLRVEQPANLITMAVILVVA
jgi:hypothetical protein